MLTLLLVALATPIALSAVVTVLLTGRARRRREVLAARDQVGRLGEGSR